MTHAFRRVPETAPLAPRELTADIAKDSAVHGRFLRLFGGIWTAVGLGLALVFSFLALALELRMFSVGAGMVSGFAIVGGILWTLGWWKRREALRIYRDGIEARGEVTEVFEDLRTRINGRSPWRVVYEFMADGKALKGFATTWDQAPPRIAAGDSVVVLHEDGHPERSVLWTRLEASGEAPRQVGGARVATGWKPAPNAALSDANDNLAAEDELRAIEAARDEEQAARRRAL